MMLGYVHFEGNAVESVRGSGEEEGRYPMRNLNLRFRAPDNNFPDVRIGDMVGYFAHELDPVNGFPL